MNPVFSIIIPVYNVAPYLRECLDSVLAQTFTDWEAICIDDGSTDGSGQLLDEYAAKDRRFRVVHQKNTGVSSARNRGLSEAKGEWILFVDGDDLWRRDVLFVCNHLIEEHPEAQIIRFARLLFAEGGCIEWQDNVVSEQIRVRDLERGLVGDDMRYSFVCNCCHRSIIPAHGFKNYVRGEDLLFRAECLLAAKQMVTTTRCLYAYRTRAGSAMQSPLNKRKLLDRIGYSLDWLTILEKRLAPAGFQNRIAMNLTESYVSGIISVGRSDQKELWDAWYDMLPKLLQFKDVRGWYRLVALVCLRVKSHGLAVLLCAVPAKAKRIIRSHLHSGG